ncbi:MAG: mechanosensitive ion channel family protein [Thermoplasmataceae archaeon]
MVRSLRREIIQMIIAIIVAIAVVYILEFALLLASHYYPALKAYDTYIKDAIGGIIAIGISIILVRIVRHIIETLSERNAGKRNFMGIFIILRVIIYAVAIFWFLSFIGVNVEGALVGGAIGGVVIGFALQSVVSNLFSGLMVSGGGLLTPGEPVSIYSWLFGQMITGTVEDVKTLYTRMRTQSGQIYLLPNTALLGSSTFVPLREGSGLKYSFNITVQADVPAGDILKCAGEKLNSGISEDNMFSASLFLGSKNGISNTILAVTKFGKVEELNQVVDKINGIIDGCYWGIKNRKT